MLHGRQQKTNLSTTPTVPALLKRSSRTSRNSKRKVKYTRPSRTSGPIIPPKKTSFLTRRSIKRLKLINKILSISYE